MKRDELERLRSKIDTVNQEIVAALNKRATISQQIGKAKAGGPVYDPTREAKVLRQVRNQGSGPLDGDALQAIFREIITACRNLQKQLTVAHLGPEGTYSELAAKAHFGTASAFKPYTTLDETLQAAEKGEADLAVLPVENSAEGSVGRTLDLLLKTPLTICAEILLPIHHQLLNSGQPLDSVREVTAHPQALAQCRKWLAANLPQARQIPATSNGEAAASSARKPGLAAIAGESAAQIYSLNILARNIEDEQNNTTRFIVLGKAKPSPTGADKTSLVCAAPNRPGALLRLLQAFANEGVNLTKLESRPAAGAAWEYVFYVDVEGHEQDTNVARALRVLKEHAAFMSILGSYPRAAQ